MISPIDNAQADPSGAPRAGSLLAELTAVTLVKLAIITAASFFIFGPHQRPHINAAKVATHLLGGPNSPNAASLTHNAILNGKTQDGKTP